MVPFNNFNSYNNNIMQNERVELEGPLYRSSTVTFCGESSIRGSFERGL